MSSNGTQGAWRYASLANTDGTLTMKFHGNASTAVTTTIDTTEWTTLTVVGYNPSTTGKVICLELYVNEEFVGSQVVNNATNFVDEGGATNLQFGHYGAAANTANMKIDNVLLYAKAVPEPTTATLSLLALVGLAARRRRR